MCSGCSVLAVVGHYVPGIMISYIIGKLRRRESLCRPVWKIVAMFQIGKEVDFSVCVSPSSAKCAAVATGGLPRAHPANVHGPGAHPDETGL